MYEFGSHFEKHSFFSDCPRNHVFIFRAHIYTETWYIIKHISAFLPAAKPTGHRKVRVVAVVVVVVVVVGGGLL